MTLIYCDGEEDKPQTYYHRHAAASHPNRHNVYAF